MWQFSFTVTYQTLVHTCKQALTQQQGPGQIAVSEDTWWNHQSQKAPSGRIKFVLMRAERHAGRAKMGPRWLEGVWGAYRGFSLHLEAYQSNGWTMIRMRPWLRKGQLGHGFHRWRIPLCFSPSCSEMRNSWSDGEHIVQTRICPRQTPPLKEAGFLPQHQGWLSYGA